MQPIPQQFLIRFHKSVTNSLSEHVLIRVGDCTYGVYSSYSTRGSSEICVGSAFYGSTLKTVCRNNNFGVGNPMILSYNGREVVDVKFSDQDVISFEDIMIGYINILFYKLMNIFIYLNI